MDNGKLIVCVINDNALGSNMQRVSVANPGLSITVEINVEPGVFIRNVSYGLPEGSRDRQRLHDTNTVLIPKEKADNRFPLSRQPSSDCHEDALEKDETELMDELGKLLCDLLGQVESMVDCSTSNITDDALDKPVNVETVCDYSKTSANESSPMGAKILGHETETHEANEGHMSVNNLDCISATCMHHTANLANDHITDDCTTRDIGKSREVINSESDTSVPTASCSRAELNPLNTARASIESTAATESADISDCVSSETTPDTTRDAELGQLEKPPNAGRVEDVTLKPGIDLGDFQTSSRSHSLVDRVTIGERPDASQSASASLASDLISRAREGEQRTESQYRNVNASSDDKINYSDCKSGNREHPKSPQCSVQQPVFTRTAYEPISPASNHDEPISLNSLAKDTADSTPLIDISKAKLPEMCYTLVNGRSYDLISPDPDSMKEKSAKAFLKELWQEGSGRLVIDSEKTAVSSSQITKTSGQFTVTYAATGRVNFHERPTERMTAQSESCNDSNQVYSTYASGISFPTEYNASTVHLDYNKENHYAVCNSETNCNIPDYNVSEHQFRSSYNRGATNQMYRRYSSDWARENPLIQQDSVMSAQRNVCNAGYAARRHSFCDTFMNNAANVESAPSMLELVELLGLQDFHSSNQQKRRQMPLQTHQSPMAGRNGNFPSRQQCQSYGMLGQTAAAPIAMKPTCAGNTRDTRTGNQSRHITPRSNYAVSNGMIPNSRYTNLPGMMQMPPMQTTPDTFTPVQSVRIPDSTAVGFNRSYGGYQSLPNGQAHPSARIMHQPVTHQQMHGLQNNYPNRATPNNAQVHGLNYPHSKQNKAAGFQNVFSSSRPQNITRVNVDGTSYMNTGVLQNVHASVAPRTHSEYNLANSPNKSASVQNGFASRRPQNIPSVNADGTSYMNTAVLQNVAGSMAQPILSEYNLANSQNKPTSVQNGFASRRPQNIASVNADGTSYMNSAVLQNVPASVAPRTHSEYNQENSQNCYTWSQPIGFVGTNASGSFAPNVPNVRNQSHKNPQRPLKHTGSDSVPYSSNIRISHVTNSRQSTPTAVTYRSLAQCRKTVQMSTNGGSAGATFSSASRQVIIEFPQSARPIRTATQNRYVDPRNDSNPTQRSATMKQSCTLPSSLVQSTCPPMQRPNTVKRDRRADHSRYQAMAARTRPQDGRHRQMLYNTVADMSTAAQLHPTTMQDLGRLQQKSSIKTPTVVPLASHPSNEARGPNTGNIKGNISAPFVQASVWKPGSSNANISAKMNVDRSNEFSRPFVSNDDRQAVKSNTEAGVRSSKLLRSDQVPSADISQSMPENTGRSDSTTSRSQINRPDVGVSRLNSDASADKNQHGDGCTKSATESNSLPIRKRILQQMVPDAITDNLPPLAAASHVKHHSGVLVETSESLPPRENNEGFNSRHHPKYNNPSHPTILSPANGDIRTHGHDRQLPVRKSTNETKSVRNVGGYGITTAATSPNESIASETFVSTKPVATHSKERELMNEANSEDDLPFCYDYKSVLEAVTNKPEQKNEDTAVSSSAKPQTGSSESNDIMQTNLSTEDSLRREGDDDSSSKNKRRYKRIIEPPTSDSDEEDADEKDYRQKAKRIKRKRRRIIEPPSSSCTDSDVDLGLHLHKPTSFHEISSPIEPPKKVTDNSSNCDLLSKETKLVRSEMASCVVKRENLSAIMHAERMNRWSKCKVVLSKLPDDIISPAPVRKGKNSERTRASPSVRKPPNRDLNLIYCGQNSDVIGGCDGSSKTCLVKSELQSGFGRNASPRIKFEECDVHLKNEVNDSAVDDVDMKDLDEESPYNSCVDECDVEDTLEHISSGTISSCVYKYENNIQERNYKYGRSDDDIEGANCSTAKCDQRSSSPRAMTSHSDDDDSLSSSFTSTDSGARFPNGEFNDCEWPFTDGDVSQDTQNETDNDFDWTAPKDFSELSPNHVDCGDDAKNIFDAMIDKLRPIPLHPTMEGAEVQLTKSLKMKNLLSLKTLRRRRENRAFRHIRSDHVIPSEHDNIKLDSNAKLRDAELQDENHANAISSLITGFDGNSTKKDCTEVMKRKSLTPNRPLIDSSNTEPPDVKGSHLDLSK